MRKYAKALVLGVGASGRAAAELLVSEGARVIAVDKSASGSLLGEASKLEQKGVEVRLGVADIPGDAFDVCIVSPGIPSDSEWVRAVENQGIEVISELELGATRCRCPIVAVTGSNGKSTLVKLCGESLAAAGCRVEMAGNYGTPLSEFARRSSEYEWVVVEVSSFQLETVKTFKPKVGVLLNVNPNHLNRHRDMETYAGIKSRLFAGMGPTDTGVAPDTNPEDIRGRAGGLNRWVSFGLLECADYQYREGTVRCRSSSGSATISVAGTLFANNVMGTTAAAAAAVVDACGLDIHCVELAVKGFKPLPHRMNVLGTIRGVQFIDDSKATNMGAMAAALEMCGGPARLIAGGQLKEDDLTPVRNVLARNVTGAYLIGEAAQKMAMAWDRVVPCHVCGHLEEALRDAWKDAKPGETILLSPACASFDQFSGFEARGEQFAELIRTIK